MNYHRSLHLCQMGEGTSSQDGTVPSVKVEESSHSINVVDKTSESVNSSIESQDVSIDKVPKGNDVESTDISITESQFSSTMPYCEESLVAKLDPVGESHFLSAQPVIRKTQLFLMRVQTVYTITTHV